MNDYYPIFVLVLIGLMGLSVWLSKSFWAYHPKGAKGYITDLLFYNLSPVVPMMAALVIFSFAQGNVPGFETSSLRYVLMAVGVLGIFFVRRLPIVAAAQLRVRTARDARFAAMSAANNSGGSDT